MMFDKPNDLKVRRGLGILEELIREKNPDYFKILNETKKVGRGIPNTAIMNKIKQI
jgi:hypothetical protein